MIRLLGRLARAGTAAAVFLLAEALLRFAPVYAEPPWGIARFAGSALPLFGVAVILAVLAALCGSPSRRSSPRPLLLGLVATGAALLLVVAGRPASGLAPTVADGAAEMGALPRGPVDVIGRDLQALPRLRRPRLAWEGDLRAPATGTYFLWAEGRGRVEVTLDGLDVLRGEGDPLHALARVPLTAGSHPMVVHLERDGPGARLRLGWILPGTASSGARIVIPPRALGPSIPRGWWLLTDALGLGVAGFLAALVLVLPWDARRGLPAPRTFTWAEIGAAAGAYAVLLAVMSWPLLTDPAHLGMTDRPDGRLNAWILAWDVHALLHEPSRLWSAPAFHPLPDALAFSENLLVPAVLSAPFQWAGGPVLAYNAALLLSLLVSGLGVAALVRRVTGDRLAAFVAGAFFAAGAHRWIRLAHLHAQVTLFLPFALLALDRFWEDHRLRNALLVGLQGLSSVYLGAITAMAIAAATVVMTLAGLGLRDLAKLGAGFVLAGLLLYPVAHPYLRMRAFEGVEFTLEEVTTYATTLESYAASGTRLYGAFTQRHLDPEVVQDTLFPGLVILVLGLCGLAAAPRRYRTVAVVASALAIVISLGPATGFYRFLHEHLVLVRGVRALSRFSLLPVMCLCVLTGLALAGRRRGLVLLALVAGLVESSQVPLGYGDWRGPSDTARWLAGKPGAVVVLPLGDGDTAAMLDGVAHWRPLVNGDSGFVPRPYARIQELLEGPLGDEGLRLLRAVGVRHVLSQTDAPLPLAATFADGRAYELPGGEEARVVEPGDPVATSWREGGALLDLGEVRPASRVVFEPNDAPWVKHPQVLVSDDGRSFEQVEAVASLADATLSLLRDPRHGKGEIRFEERKVRYVHLGPRVPARRGILEVGRSAR